MQELVVTCIGFLIPGFFCILGYHIYGLMRYHHLTDKDILRAIGFNWRDLESIREKIIHDFNHSDRILHKEPTKEFLSKKLHKLVRKGCLIDRVAATQTNGKAQIKFEYRNTAYSLPRKPRKIWQLKLRNMGV